MSNHELNKIIGARIKERREAAGLTRVGLAGLMRAHRINWSHAAVWNLEAGKRNLRYAEAITLAGILGATLTDFAPQKEQK